MKINIKALKANPTNPRKISDANLNKLVQGILSFPSMLEVRSLIVNKDNIVLAGNMRLRALTKICQMRFMEVEETLRTSGFFNELGEEKQDELIAFWEHWCHKPEVDVIQSSLTKEEEDELVIKDNISFGEFDLSILKDLFTQNELIEIGLDESLFYDPMLDDKVLVTREGSAPRQIGTVKIGTYECEISLDEYSELEDRFKEHVAEVGTSFGFVTTIKKAYGIN